MSKPRARALGIPLEGTPGTYNAITDVAGVEVGYTTRIEGDAIRMAQQLEHQFHAEARLEVDLRTQFLRIHGLESGR